MTPEQFVYWFQGFMEINNPTEITHNQMIIIRDHLNTCFEKVTPSRSDYCLPNNHHDGYNILSTTHTGITAGRMC